MAKLRQVEIVCMMTSKELESVRKKSIHSQDFLSTTKSSIITSDLQKLSQTIRKSIAAKKSVTVLVIESDK
jgi:hypothetical protein